MTINRHNYEEYFILYLDNELDAAGRRMVDEFVTLHPDLQEELSFLLQTKFTPDNKIVFENKQELQFAKGEQAGLANYEEWLVLYSDNELNETQRAAVEKWVAENPVAKTTAEQIQRTKLIPETIVFPDKESLYRREEKRRPVILWRLAAAAVFTGIAVVTAVSISNNQSSEDPAVVAATTGKIQVPNNETPAAKSTKDNNSPSIDNRNTAAIPVAPVKQQEEGVRTNQQAAKKQVNNKESIKQEIAVRPPSNNLPTAEENPNVNSTANVGHNKTDRVTTPSKDALTNTSEFGRPDLVTKDGTYASSKSTSELPDPGDPDMADGKKNKLRGFFRKVTRNFEKRTNIEATDDDDRLLVGGLAIRLK